MPKTFIAGGAGFLGRQLMTRFNEAYAPSSEELDLTYEPDVIEAYLESTPEIVINAAGRVSGIIQNRDYPADHYWDNLIIGSYLLDSAWRFGVKKFVQIGTVCSYPKHGSIPFREEDFWLGYPEETNAPYGMAKRSLIVHGQALSKQYGFSFISPILTNLYGPGDHYEEERSHVIPGMIAKFMDAVEMNKSTVTLFGTGECSREFLYVEDAADAIKFLTENYNSPEIINVCTGYEIKIKALAEMIKELCGFKGAILWDTSKPDGQPRRNFSNAKIKTLGWEAKFSLADGLYKTVESYKAQRMACLS